jgi:DNA transposition AAA+ family ATPase
LSRKVAQWLEAIDARRKTLGRLPEAPGYTDTPAARRIASALTYAQMAADITVIYGGAGVGKTYTALAYQTSHPGVHIATMSPATASAATALEEIAEALGLANIGSGAARHQRAIIRRLARTQGLLIIDEAQHLGIQALDAVRALHDATGIGVALIGNEQVYARMTGGSRAAYLDRLYSRIGKRVRLAQPSREDVDTLLGAWGIANAEAVRALREIGAKPGGLRGVAKVLRLATMFADGEPITLDHVRAAWKDLGGEG